MLSQSLLPLLLLHITSIFHRLFSPSHIHPTALLRTTLILLDTSLKTNNMARRDDWLSFCTRALILALSAAIIFLICTTTKIDVLLAKKYCNEEPYSLRWKEKQILQNSPTTFAPCQISAEVPQQPLFTSDRANTEGQILSSEQSNEDQNTIQARTMEEEMENPEMENPMERSAMESLTACLVNGDCGLGYGCFEGVCKPGCSTHSECPSGYECRYGRWGYRCFEKTGWHRECREHLRVCSRHLQCCSGVCERRRGDMLCRSVV